MLTSLTAVRPGVLANVRILCVHTVPSLRRVPRRGVIRHPEFGVLFRYASASITLTLDTYSHVLLGMDGGAAWAMDEALG